MYGVRVRLHVNTYNKLNYVEKGRRKKEGKKKNKQFLHCINCGAGAGGGRRMHYCATVFIIIQNIDIYFFEKK